MGTSDTVAQREAKRATGWAALGAVLAELFRVVAPLIEQWLKGVGQ